MNRPPTKDIHDSAGKTCPTPVAYAVIPPLHKAIFEYGHQKPSEFTFIAPLVQINTLAIHGHM